MPSIILILDDEKTAKGLHTLTQDTIYKLDSNPSFTESIEEITISAHTDSDGVTIGGKTPPELAASLAHMLSKNKTQLQHLYLLACEAGISINGQPSLAQQVAIEMKRQGFPMSTQIHAIAPPFDSRAYSMRVKVTEQAGISKKGGDKDGQVRAFIYQDQASETRDIGNKSNESDKNKTFFFSAQEEYKTDLKKKHNTFTTSGPDGVISMDMALAIFHLKRQKPVVQIAFKNEPDRVAEILKEIDAHIAYLELSPSADQAEVHKKLHMKFHEKSFFSKKEGWHQREGKELTDASHYYRVIKLVLNELSALTPVRGSFLNRILTNVPEPSMPKKTNHDKNVRKKKSKPEDNESVYDEEKKSLITLAAFSNALLMLTNKIESLTDSAAKKAASTLYDTLFDYYTDYCTNPSAEKLDDFKINGKKAIDASRPVLEQHRGWKHRLEYLAILLTGIVPYLIAASIHKLSTGRFLFFSTTDSAKKLDAIQSTLTNLEDESQLDKPLK